MLLERLQFRKGGKAKSKVNEAGNYTQAGDDERNYSNRIKSQASHGTAAGKWSARKAQALAKQYKEKVEVTSNDTCKISQSL